MKHRQWTTKDLNKVLWTDESEFKILGSSHRVFVRCLAGERMVTQCVTPTVQHGGATVMVWGSLAGPRVGDLHRVTCLAGLNTKKYPQVMSEQL